MTIEQEATAWVTAHGPEGANDFHRTLASHININLELRIAEFDHARDFYDKQLWIAKLIDHQRRYPMDPK